METLRSFLAATVLRLDPPNRTRTEPMQVLALGLSRSGTDSLREALITLGYPTYHGWQTVAQPEDHFLWDQFKRRKFLGSPSSTSSDKDRTKITAAEFDRILGDCTGVSDMPAVAFAPELVEAYPEAKVILNYRKDVDKWYQSTVETFGAWQNNFFTTRFPMYFSAYMFPAEMDFICPRTGLFDLYYRGSFIKNGIWVHRDHYATIRGMVPRENLLEWCVEDGWGPLCEFLGKEVPETPFPHTDTRDAFSGRIAEDQAKWKRTGKRNMIIFGAVTAVGLAVGVRYLARFVPEIRNAVTRLTR